MVVTGLRRLRGSRFGGVMAKLWHKLAASPPGRLLIRQTGRLTEALRAKWRHWSDLYRKLTSPPPDPMMAAMMMQDEPIDMDQDDIRLTGNKVFVYITAFFAVFVLWASFAKLDESVGAEGRWCRPVPSNWCRTDCRVR